MSNATLNKTLSEVGVLLKRWRQIHGLSQLDLALAAESSARHVSFIETGRSRPSREMVLRLCEVMKLPLRERNRVLNAAGYSPAYKETALDQEGLGQVKRVLDCILENQEPYPALVMNRCFDILMINHSGAKFMNLLGLQMGGSSGPANLLRMTLHPDGFKRIVRDWEKTASHIIHRAHRQVRGTGDEDPLAALLHEVLAYPGVPSEWRLDDATQDAPPVLPVEFELGGNILSWISTIASFGTPQDVTAEEIMVESLFPANRETEEVVKALMNGS